MGPLERLIGRFYLFRYIVEEEKGEGREFVLFRKSFLVSFLLPEPSPQSLPRASQESPKSLIFWHVARVEELPNALLSQKHLLASRVFLDAKRAVAQQEIRPWHRGFAPAPNPEFQSPMSGTDFLIRLLEGLPESPKSPKASRGTQTTSQEAPSPKK